ncbi:MAG: hypothetical protein JW862_11895 [Anaerolineales bacterium]|nr:hypothetical protein [Anaerolineales bacterium]
MTKAWLSIFSCVLLLILLPACQLGSSNDIVGRWEFGDQDFGMAYEFYEDGTGFIFNSLDPFYPMGGDFTYTYEPESGVLRVTTWLTETTERTTLYIVTFASNDEISLEQSGLKPFTYNRKPIPELPAGARSRLGAMMLGKDFTLVEAEKLSAGWEGKYGDYVIVARTDIEMTIGEKAEEWLVTLQVEGEGDPRLFVLRKGEGRWGVLELVPQ